VSDCDSTGTSGDVELPRDTVLVSSISDAEAICKSVKKKNMNIAKAILFFGRLVGQLCEVQEVYVRGTKIGI
jgi:hypothetical protein